MRGEGGGPNTYCKFYPKQPLINLRATVIQQFQITEKKEKVAVAGCRVRVGSKQYVSNLENLQVGMGRLPRDGTYRVSRAGVTLFEGRLASLKHQKVKIFKLLIH